jgi:hypothetical protein
MRASLVGIICLFLAIASQAQIRRTVPGAPPPANSRTRNQSSPQRDPHLFDGTGPIWWGGNFQLGFSGYNGVSSLQFGLSPMFGYKLTPRFSLGPRVGGLLTRYSYRFGNTRASVSPVTWSVAGFARYKFIDQLFGHLEYEYQNQGIVLFTNSPNILEVARVPRNNLYLGAGYSSGVGVNRGEILILYNFNRTYASGFYQSPITFRFGFTHNF